MVEDIQKWKELLAAYNWDWVAMYEWISPFLFFGGVISFIILWFANYKAKRSTSDTHTGQGKIYVPVDNNKPKSVREKILHGFEQAMREEKASQDAAEAASQLFKNKEDEK